jgi:hypothetical protein
MLKLSKYLVKHSTWILLKRMEEDPESCLSICWDARKEDTSVCYLVSHIRIRDYPLIDYIFLVYQSRKVSINLTAKKIYENLLK